MNIMIYMYAKLFKWDNIDLCSSTPRESELIEVNTLVLTEVGSGQEQLIILNGQAMMGSSVTIVDARTLRVHLAIEDDLLLGGAFPKTIELMGFAKVKDIALGADGPSLNTQFMLEFAIVSNQIDLESGVDSSSASSTISTATTTTPTSPAKSPTLSPATISPTTTAIPTGVLSLGAKVCQCDQESNVCVTDDLQMSYASKDDIHICIM